MASLPRAWAVRVEVANDTSQRDLPQFIGESLDELKGRDRRQRLKQASAYPVEIVASG